jgi:hypothetical protein
MIELLNRAKAAQQPTRPVSNDSASFIAQNTQPRGSLYFAIADHTGQPVEAGSGAQHPEGINLLADEYCVQEAEARRADYASARGEPLETGLELLKGYAEENGGPFEELLFSAHGAPDRIYDGQFGDPSEASGQSVDSVVRQMINGNIIAEGSTLILSSCDVAGSEAAREELSRVAQAYSITLHADAKKGVCGVLTEPWIFEPTGAYRAL